MRALLVVVFAASLAAACGEGDPCEGVACSDEERCDDGTCTCGGHECPDGFACCDESCVNVQFDPENCGACGHACLPEQQCTAGTCG